MHILIIEDNPGDSLLIEQYLLKRFHSLTIDNAQTYEVASQKIFSHHNYSVLLLDLDLPDLKGHYLLDKVLSITTCPVIILTGYADLNLSQESLAKGVSDFLIKDELTPENLYKSVIHALERKRFIDDLRATKDNYRNLFHLSPQPKWIYELETFRILDANNAALRQYGYSLEEFTKLTINDIRPNEHIPKLISVVKSRKKNTKSLLRSIST